MLPRPYANVPREVSLFFYEKLLLKKSVFSVHASNRGSGKTPQDQNEMRQR